MAHVLYSHPAVQQKTCNHELKNRAEETFNLQLERIRRHHVISGLHSQGVRKCAASAVRDVGGCSTARTIHFRAGL